MTCFVFPQLHLRLISPPSPPTPPYNEDTHCKIWERTASCSGVANRHQRRSTQPPLLPPNTVSFFFFPLPLGFCLGLLVKLAHFKAAGLTALHTERSHSSACWNYADISLEYHFRTSRSLFALNIWPLLDTLQHAG